MKGKPSRSAFSQFKERKQDLVLIRFLPIIDFSKGKNNQKYSIRMLNNLFLLTDNFVL